MWVVLFLIDTREPPPPPPSPPRRARLSKTARAVLLRLVLGIGLLIAADVVDGAVGMLLAFGGFAAVCSAAARAIPISWGLTEYRQ